MKNKSEKVELKEDIIEAVQDATDTVDGTVSIPILDHFLDGILTKQCNIADVRLSLLNKVKEIAFGDGSAQERMVEIKALFINESN